jgi:hypothetical protein
MKPPEVPFPRAAQLPPYGENKKRNFRREREGDRLKEKPNNDKKRKEEKGGEKRQLRATGQSEDFPSLELFCTTSIHPPKVL